MEVNLYRPNSVTWIVKCNKVANLHTTIESAADEMLALGVRDEDIDAALIELEARDDTRANFGINGRFILTDKAKHNEVVGVA